MEFLIGLFGLLYIAYRLADEKWTASMNNHRREINDSADSNRMNAWLSRVVNNDVEKELLRRCGENDPEIVKEVRELGKFYGREFYVTDKRIDHTGSLGGDTIDALLANRGLVRESHAKYGFWRPNKYQLEFIISLNENLKMRGINEQMYAETPDKYAPLKKIEDIKLGDSVYTGVERLKWFPSLSSLEKECSDSAKRKRGESDWFFNDYIPW